jgi:hypothetical protein
MTPDGIGAQTKRITMLSPMFPPNSSTPEEPALLPPLGGQEVFQARRMLGVVPARNDGSIQILSTAPKERRASGRGNCLQSSGKPRFALRSACAFSYLNNRDFGAVFSVNWYQMPIVFLELAISVSFLVAGWGGLRSA